MLKVRCREYLSGLQNLIGEEIPKVDIAKALIKYGVSKQKDVDKLANNISNRCFNDGYFKPEEVEVLDMVFKSNGNQLQKYDDITPQSDKVLIDYYPDVLVSCGNGIFSLGETKEQMTVPKKLIKGYSDSYKYVIVTAFSDSMQPEIKEKDMLIVRVAEMENIIDNHIYIFCHEGRFYCKYLSYNLGQVIVRSLNPEYPTRYIEKENLENFELIGEVCGIFRNVV